MANDSSSFGSKPNKPSSAALQGLVEEARTLEVEDILDLCYAFAHDRWRLYAYLEALRTKGGRQSQIAACLICYDLAKQGEKSFQIEFAGLLPVMRKYCQTPPPPKTGSSIRPVDALIGNSPYLKGLLADLEKLFDTEEDDAHDQNFDAAAADQDSVPNRIDLFSDEDWGEDLDGVLDVSDERMLHAWNTALDRFLGVGSREPDASFGFTGSKKSDIAGVARLVDEAKSLIEIPDAYDLLPLAQLYLASHLPRQNIFGFRNRARSGNLEEAALNLLTRDKPPGRATHWLLPPTGAQESWEHVATMLIDMIQFLLTEKRSALRNGTPKDIARAYSKRNILPVSLADRIRADEK